MDVGDARYSDLGDPAPAKRRRVDGRLHLAFEAQAGSAAPRTICRVREQRPPLQMVRAFPLADGATLVHLHNISGGILTDDRLETTIDVGPNARAQLTTTGATRLYRSRTTSQHAEQTTDVRIGAGGLLEHLPDPIIPFAGSRYRQTTRIALEEDAGLIWWETIAPGRVAHGEIFAYDRLQLHVDLSAPEKPLARERVTLEPRERPLGALARLGPYRYLSTLYVCRVGMEAARWSELEEQLSKVADALSRPGESLWGVSSLVAHGVVVRALSRDGRDIPAGLLTFWGAAKRALYGQAITPPRKVY